MGAATVSIPSTGTQVATAASVATPTTLTPGLPATRANGDVLLCFTCCRSSTPTVSVSGWTQILNIAATNGRIALFALRVDGSEVAPSVVWASLTTGTSGTGAMAQIAAVRGLNASLALSSLADVVGASNDQAASTTAAAGGAAITPTWNGALVLSLTVRLDDAGTWSTLAAAENVTWANVAAAFGSTSGADEAQDWQWGQQSAATLIAAKTKTLSGASSFASSGAMVSLKPLIVVPLGSASSAATPTLAVTAATQVPLGSAASAATAALSLSAATAIPLGAAAATATPDAGASRGDRRPSQFGYGRCDTDTRGDGADSSTARLGSHDGDADRSTHGGDRYPARERGGNGDPDSSAQRRDGDRARFGSGSGIGKRVARTDSADRGCHSAGECAVGHEPRDQRSHARRSCSGERASKHVARRECHDCSFRLAQQVRAQLRRSRSVRERG
jgi:hypothetical protein